MHGRPPRMSGRREIRLPISVTVAIAFKYNARLKPGTLIEQIFYRKPLTANLKSLRALVSARELSIPLHFRSAPCLRARLAVFRNRRWNACGMPGELILEGYPFMLNKYSSRVTQPKSQGASQAMLYATALTAQDMHTAQVGIGSGGFDDKPCNMHVLNVSD